MGRKPIDHYGLVGWREWVVFSDFHGARVKAKVDTGARTSAIHAECVSPFERDGAQWVSFVLFPNQGDQEAAVTCEARVLDRRRITNSGGQRNDRFIVQTTIEVGDQRWPIELSLTNRATLGFRMLLGRTALRGRFLVDPGASYLKGQSLPG